MEALNVYLYSLFTMHERQVIFIIKRAFQNISNNVSMLGFMRPSFSVTHEDLLFHNSLRR